MSLTPGTRISAYEIIDVLGAGAMGEVYRARDTTLGREVAVKVLPDEFAQDAERLARFEREARLVAQLNHPGIAAVYGLEADGETRFIVMELVPGETLGARIARAPIPWREALAIAVQIADALDVAHEAGIVHRDLKPDNVGLTTTDTAKLLDFGLGKPMNEELQRAVGSSQQMTQAGAILGTPAYISPEQFRGKLVDRRADIWAFGCLLYEMLTGAPAFPGETVGEIAAGVLKNEPDWTALPDDAPKALARLVRDCLEKDPRERLRDIGEARRSLEHMLSGETLVASAPAAVSHQRRAVAWPLAATLAVAALAAGVLVGLGVTPGNEEASSAASSRPALGFHVPLPEGTAALKRTFLSADGSTLGLLLKDKETGVSSVWRRQLDASTISLENVPVTKGATAACLSSDGGSIAFVRDEKLYRLDLDTGDPTPLCPCRDSWHGRLSWGDDGQILFGEWENGGAVLKAVDASGGTPREVSTLGEGEARHIDPTWLGPGRLLALTQYTPPSDPEVTPEDNQLVLHRSGAHPTRVCKSSSTGWPVGDWLLHRIKLKLLARPFDEDTGVAGETAYPVADDVRAFCATRAGVIVFQGGAKQYGSQLVWMDPTGRTLDEVGEPGDIGEPVPSPVDDQIVVSLYSGIPKLLDLWIVGPTGVRQRLTNREHAFGAVWSPDGTKIAYSATAEGRSTVYWRASDGSGERHRIDDAGNVHDWSPDGQWLCYSHDTDDNRMCFRWVGDIQGATAAPPEERVRHLDEKFPYCGRFSPDGKWITYAAGKGKDCKTYIRPFKVGFGTRRMVSDGQGDYPDWSPTANEIVFIRGDRKAMRVRLEQDGDGVLQPTPPEELFEVRQDAYNRAFEYSHDGKRILVNRKPEPNLNPVTVIVGWKPPDK